jgi:hypothetical protein
MVNLIWHDYLVLISFIACIAGLLLLSDSKQAQKNEFESTEQTLFMMIFAYWIVYCVAVGIQKFGLPEDWQMVLQSLRITAILSYFLTFACVLSLPCHIIFAVRQVED